jgi:arginine decarboxylase
MNLVPKKIFFTSGIGRHSEHLESFEAALRNAGIEKFNLVTVSSILPPNCKIVSKEEGLSELYPGEIVFCVLSRISSDEPGDQITASIGCAVPSDQNTIGYISEYHGAGQTKTSAGDYAEKLAREMYQSWTEKDPLKTTHIAITAEADNKIKWTTAIAAAIFII